VFRDIVNRVDPSRTEEMVAWSKVQFRAFYDALGSWHFETASRIYADYTSTIDTWESRDSSR
jgi:hypothetical protein